MKSLKFYYKIWLMFTKNAFSAVLSQRVALLFFLAGKVIRFGAFIFFLYFIVRGAKDLAGYSASQAIFFFLTFTLVDTLSQFLFREVYRFRPKIISGDFDLALTKPVSPLFVSLMGGPDIIDLVTLPPLLLAIFYIGSFFDPAIMSVVLFLLLVANSLLIATAFHIAVLAMGIITLEIDHNVMIYRDLSSFGRFPVEVYKEPVKGVLTYFIPVGIMMTLPAKGIMGLVSIPTVIMSFGFGILFVFLALKFWNFALTKYTSASS